MYKEPDTKFHIEDVFADYKLHSGRMVGYSKSQYRLSHPDNEVYFNANIFTEEDGKIWWGDIDYTIDLENLQHIARVLEKKLYILREMDGRFENDQLDVQTMKSKAVKVIE